MIPAPDLKLLARGRLRDARALFRAGRYDASAYICGYAVEVALKARICRTLKWNGFPHTNSEFDGLQSFRTHRLDILLRISGQAERITRRFLPEWGMVVRWNPERRYLPIGSTSRREAQDMLKAVEVIVRTL
jgi:HEPN domain-containing protein